VTFAALALGGGAALLWTRSTRGAGPAAGGTPTADIMLPQRSRGDTTAPITIYAFSDFQCPYCRRFTEETMPILEREYIATGKARMVFVNYPLPQLHANATAAHNFAMCAARQKRFWPAHDLLFQRQEEWGKLPDPQAYFRRLGDAASRDAAALESCMGGRSEDWIVQADSREAAQLGITGTPAFLINGGLLPGAQPMEVWRPILDSIHHATVPKR
jgi:protein-disulfide isomerase